MLKADIGPSTYNRYTYYRLLSQMGVESAPEQNKLNLNYVNVDANGNVVPGMETNLIPWTKPCNFSPTPPTGCCAIIRRNGMVASPSNYVATFSLTTNIGTSQSHEHASLASGTFRCW